MEENRLSKKIELLEEEYNINPDDIETFNNLQLKGALFRSQAQITNFSEKPTKFFLNLENIN